MRSTPLKSLTRAAVLSLAVASTSLQAAEFQYTVPRPGAAATKVEWDQGGVWRDRSGNLYESGQYPGATDSIIGLNGEAPNAVTEFFLNGDRTIAGLEGGELTSVRLFNGSAGGEGGDNTLTITGRLQGNDGNRFYFRSQAGGKLTISTASYGQDGNMLTEVGTSANVNNGNVSFSSKETIFTGEGARFTVSSYFDAANGYISLGHVTFDTNTGFNSGITIQSNASGTGTSTVHVASLRSTDESTEGRIQGAGTVLIDPGTSTLAPAGFADFNRTITGSIRIEKKGESLQIFSFSDPVMQNLTANTYTGGTLIGEGTLAVRNYKGSGLGSGAVTVGNKGTLAGNGRIELGAGNAITVESGGRVAPGEDNKIRVGSEAEQFEHQHLTLVKTQLKMEEGSSFAFRVSADGASDQLVLSNYQADGLTLEGGAIRINISGELAVDKTYVLFTFTDANGAAKSSGLTNGLVDGDGFEGYVATFYYDQEGYGGVGTISMSVTAIPEPSAALLILPFLAGAYCYRQRLQKR